MSEFVLVKFSSCFLRQDFEKVYLSQIFMEGRASFAVLLSLSKTKLKTKT